eukprot:GILJ01003129.1.p1 GENE.GILJ01003129.1~~GILJ01003129.1.p1  ORF type:complete len:162 (-),score=24.30 GILJ01003129.1:164-649(-)
MAKSESKAAKEINIVHQQKIYAETVRKELAHQSVNHNFQLNPRSVILISDKPNQMVPGEGLDWVPTTENEIEFQATFDRVHMRPKEKFTMPLTANQEYGWDVDGDKEAHSKNRRWYYGQPSSDVTQYADSYLSMLGSNPFIRKGPNSNTAGDRKSRSEGKH